VRWIVDYKTSSPKTEEDEESFKSRELMNYRAQLDTYADLLKNLREVVDVPIRTALYFPAIQALALR
jgi:ATP-dependent exoDNAse (exonuclease V) beta subunit